MLVGFLGVACSGKTTLAARLFYELKDIGITTEFIPELARTYIANFKTHNRLKHDDPVKLTDRDQLNIIIKQFETEKVMVSSCSPRTVILTDSSVFNTIAYSEKAYTSDLGKELLQESLSRYDLLFYCEPVPIPKTIDSNRIHTANEILKLNETFLERLDKLNVKFQRLGGTQAVRFSIVFPEVLNKIEKCL